MSDKERIAELEQALRDVRDALDASKEPVIEHGYEKADKIIADALDTGSLTHTIEHAQAVGGSYEVR